MEVLQEPRAHTAAGGAAPKVRFAEIKAEIIRADGTRIPLGMIDGTARNPFRAVVTWFRRLAAQRRIRNANRSLES